MAEKAPIRVVITGAAGQIGYSLIYMVSSGYVFGADQPVILHLLDIAPMMGVLGGVVMEIADCALPLVKDVVATDDAVKAFKVINIYFTSYFLSLIKIPKYAYKTRKLKTNGKF